MKLPGISSRRGDIKYLKWYYLLTPVFALPEFLFDVEIRFAAPEAFQDYRYLYYGVCFLGAWFLFNNQLTASLFSLVECSINILLHILSILYPVMTMAATLDAGLQPKYRFDGFDLFHFGLVGVVLLYSFYSNPLILGSRRF